MTVRAYKPHAVNLDSLPDVVRERHLIMEKESVDRIIIDESLRLVTLITDGEAEYFDHNNSCLEIL